MQTSDLGQPSPRRASQRAVAVLAAAALSAVTVVVTAPSAGALTPPSAGAVTALAAAGNAKAYAFSSVKRPGDPIARFDPCSGRIGWRINPARATKTSLADTKEAFKRLSAATGLTFVYRGTTKVIPGTKSTYPKDTKIVLAWVTPGMSSYLPKPPKGYTSAAGYGGGYYQDGVVDARRKPAYLRTSGFVVINAPLNKTLASGFGTGPRYGAQGTQGQLLMHELGHVVGLDHAPGNDKTEIMYPTMTRKTAVYGAGDRVGLKILGKASGCLKII